MAKREAGGIRKWEPILLSMVLPCFMKSELLCNAVIAKIKQENQMGTILNISLVSSTWVTGQTTHGFGFLLPCASVVFHSEESGTIMAALSRNLIRSKPKRRYQNNMVVVSVRFSDLKDESIYHFLWFNVKNYLAFSRNCVKNKDINQKRLGFGDFEIGLGR